LPKHLALCLRGCNARYYCCKSLAYRVVHEFV
jgi:hypothetical protein